MLRVPQLRHITAQHCKGPAFTRGFEWSEVVKAYNSVSACRDAEDTFYDRTDIGPRQKKAVEVESLDAATLLGQKVCWACDRCSKPLIIMRPQ